MAEFTMEVCDATPSYVEERVDESVDQVQRYCPWKAGLVQVQDYRWTGGSRRRVMHLC